MSTADKIAARLAAQGKPLRKSTPEERREWAEQTQAHNAASNAASEAYWTPKLAAEKEARQQQWYAHLDKQKGLLPGTNSAFKQVNNGLIAAGDAAVEKLPGMGNVGNLYKTFAPPGSKFHTEGSLAEKAGRAATGYVAKTVNDGIHNAAKGVAQSAVQKLTGGKRKRQQLGGVGEEDLGIVRPDGRAAADGTRLQKQRRHNAAWETVLERVMDNYGRPALSSVRKNIEGVQKERDANSAHYQYMLQERDEMYPPEMPITDDVHEDFFTQHSEILGTIHEGVESRKKHEKLNKETMPAAKSEVAKLAWLHKQLQEKRMAGRGKWTDRAKSVGTAVGKAALGVGAAYGTAYLANKAIDASKPYVEKASHKVMSAVWDHVADNYAKNKAPLAYGGGPGDAPRLSVQERIEAEKKRKYDEDKFRQVANLVLKQQYHDPAIQYRKDGNAFRQSENVASTMFDASQQREMEANRKWFKAIKEYDEGGYSYWDKEAATAATNSESYKTMASQFTQDMLESEDKRRRLQGEAKNLVGALFEKKNPNWKKHAKMTDAKKARLGVTESAASLPPIGPNIRGIKDIYA